MVYQSTTSNLPCRATCRACGGETRAQRLEAQRRHRSDRKAQFMATFTRPLAIKVVLMTTILLSATACGNTWGQRAVTGGAIGAGAGAGLGAATGIGILPGAVIG